MRFVGHLDLMRVLERAMRRSKFPVNYSQGFNPRPRMAFASALTLGATSEWELCQLDLDQEWDEEHVRASFDLLRQQLPAGFTIEDVWPIPLEKKNPYIQVQAAGYTLTVEGSADGDAAVLTLQEFFRSGPGIPAAQDLSVEAVMGPGPAEGVEPGAGAVVRLKLPVGDRGGVRIRDVAAAIEQANPGLRVTGLHRSRLWCEAQPGGLEE